MPNQARFEQTSNTQISFEILSFHITFSKSELGNGGKKKKKKMPWVDFAKRFPAFRISKGNGGPICVEWRAEKSFVRAIFGLISRS